MTLRQALTDRYLQEFPQGRPMTIREKEEVDERARQTIEDLLATVSILEADASAQRDLPQLAVLSRMWTEISA